MLETPDELDALQALLDASAAVAGPHLADIATPERRLDAAGVCERLQGMCLLVVATVTADGRPLTAPVDGYLLHGSFHFSTGRQAVKAGHLATRPWLSATHLPSERLCVSVHGTAEIYELDDPGRPELLKAMLDWYVPRQGEQFEDALGELDALAVRIDARRMVAFTVEG